MAGEAVPKVETIDLLCPFTIDPFLPRVYFNVDSEHESLLLSPSM
jgi:hypothetical protein